MTDGTPDTFAAFRPLVVELGDSLQAWHADEPHNFSQLFERVQQVGQVVGPLVVSATECMPRARLSIRQALIAGNIPTTHGISWNIANAYSMAVPLDDRLMQCGVGTFRSSPWFSFHLGEYRQNLAATTENSVRYRQIFNFRPKTDTMRKELSAEGQMVVDARLYHQILQDALRNLHLGCVWAME